MRESCERSTQQYSIQTAAALAIRCSDSQSRASNSILRSCFPLIRQVFSIYFITWSDSCQISLLYRLLQSPVETTRSRGWQTFFSISKGTVAQNFSFRCVFHESSFPRSLRIQIPPFRSFSTIRKDIHISRCTTSANDIVGKWETFFIIRF